MRTNDTEPNQQSADYAAQCNTCLIKYTGIFHVLFVVVTELQLLAENHTAVAKMCMGTSSKHLKPRQLKYTPINLTVASVCFHQSLQSYN